MTRKQELFPLTKPGMQIMMSRLISLFTVLFIMLPPQSAAGSDDPILIGLDGEFSLPNSTSAQAIERGARIAIEEINHAGGLLGGRPLKLITRDNRSVPARGIENIREFAAMQDLVAVIGGRFSPVILDELPILHKNEMILLAAWSAADGVTDHQFRPSYTFRLSLRDSYAMPVMMRQARHLGAAKVGLMVPNTGWGRSNVAAAKHYLSISKGIQLVDTIWYNWGEKDMLRHYRELQSQGAEAIILVANDPEAAVLVRQLGSDESDNGPLPIIAHWGVTGGDFVKMAGPMLSRLNFSVVQTFSLYRAEAAIRDRVLEKARQQFNIKSIEEVSSAVGFGHAYDLVHILARAIELAGSVKRPEVRDALEKVRNYRGLTGDYPRPFTAERHDAMHPEQVFMARYREDGVVVPLTSPQDGTENTGP
jgi:branched-chain amino acid transport system substrate-binding protein